MNNKIIWVAVIIIILGAGGWYYINFGITDSPMPVLDADNQPENSVPSITAEELKQGWYWGEDRKNGTPEIWTKSGEGSRSAGWYAPGVSIGSTANVKEFIIDGKDFSFMPAVMSVNKGDRVKITFKNTQGFHDLRIEGYDMGTEKIQAGNESSFEFMADKTGTFTYYCSVGSHRAKGMTGTFTVK